MDKHFELSTAAKVRKSLLIFSLIGIFLKETRECYTGNIAFLGFEFPLENLDVILNFFVYIIGFYLAAFFLRTLNEWAVDTLPEDLKKVEYIPRAYKDLGEGFGEDIPSEEEANAYKF